MRRLMEHGVAVKACSALTALTDSWLLIRRGTGPVDLHFFSIPLPPAVTNLNLVISIIQYSTWQSSSCNVSMYAMCSGRADRRSSGELKL